MKKIPQLLLELAAKYQAIAAKFNSQAMDGLDDYLLEHDTERQEAWKSLIAFYHAEAEKNALKGRLALFAFLDEEKFL